MCIAIYTPVDSHTNPDDAFFSIASSIVKFLNLYCPCHLFPQKLNLLIMRSAFHIFSNIFPKDSFLFIFDIPYSPYGTLPAIIGTSAFIPVVTFFNSLPYLYSFASLMMLICFCFALIVAFK